MDQKEALKTTMMALIYPAVHGAGLVWLISTWVEINSPVAVAAEARSYLALWLVLFFGISYVIISDVPSERYTGWAFTCDLVEIILVFSCFVALGYVKPSAPNYSWAFGLLSAVPIVQSLWNHKIGRTRLWNLSIITTGVCIAVALSAKNHTWAVYVGIAALYGLLGFYFKERRYQAH